MKSNSYIEISSLLALVFCSNYDSQTRARESCYC